MQIAWLQAPLNRSVYPQLHLKTMDVFKTVCAVLDDVLSLGGRSAAFTRETPLLGAIAELDSMAVVSVITTLEERLGLVIGDDIDGQAFATAGSLTEFVEDLLARQT